MFSIQTTTMLCRRSSTTNPNLGTGMAMKKSSQRLSPTLPFDRSNPCMQTSAQSKSVGLHTTKFRSNPWKRHLKKSTSAPAQQSKCDPRENEHGSQHFVSQMESVFQLLLGHLALMRMIVVIQRPVAIENFAIRLFIDQKE